jgi:hypothetical protein
MELQVPREPGGRDARHAVVLGRLELLPEKKGRQAMIIGMIMKMHNMTVITMI